MCEAFISVVVPFYNVEWEMLKKCLDSILCQKYKNMEIHLVDDCSEKETTFNKCRQYTQNIQNIYLCRNCERRGVSYSRNRAIEDCKGEYILFVDADDWVDSRLFHNLNAEIELNNPDTIFFEHYVVTKNSVTLCHREVMADDCRCLSSNMVKRMLLGKDFNTVWNVLYSKKIIMDKNIRFFESVKLGEDFIFNYQYFKEFNNGSYIRKGLYYYRFNVDSVTNVFNFNRVIDAREGYYIAKQMVEEHFSNNSEVKKGMYSSYYSSLLSHLMKCILAKESKKVYFQVLQLDWVKDLMKQRPSGIAMNGIRFLLSHDSYFMIFLIAQIKKIRMQIKYGT